MAVRILVVEDGREYVEAFRGLSGGVEIELTRAGSLAEARAALEPVPFQAASIQAVFLDVVFDRSAEEDLAGDLTALIARFGGDRARALAQLRENQGFYLLDALAPLLPPPIRVVIAYDFDAEPHRLAALRRRVPQLVGLPDGTSLAVALRLLLG